ncbi:MAG: Gfo/Idh/MocA family oxidoreductase, partial [Gammaproteobacteria bacterium]|nr:Gfo/Idh/MocA family oxidoreductase [Gammaproteobacteria bacterium]
MESKLRVGVVGVGHFGNYHAQIYSKMPGTTLVAVADCDRKRAQSVALACRCMAVTDPLALLDQVDAVSIAVPTVHHLEVARPFLEKGIHVLLEKPIATNSNEAVELISLARRNNAILQIGHLERFNGGVRALLENAKDVQFIEAHRLGIFSNRSTDVDVIMDLMIHDIDIVLALTQSEPIKIDAAGTPVL